MTYQSYPWWAVHRAREASEEQAKHWRTELVKIGEEVLGEMEKHGVPEDVIVRFRDFVEKARSAGIYRS